MGFCRHCEEADYRGKLPNEFQRRNKSGVRFDAAVGIRRCGADARSRRPEAAVSDGEKLPERARAWLDFWFGPPGDPERYHHRQLWFRSTPEFDEAVRAGFAADHDAAVSGALADWENAPLSALALVMLLDQVPRHIFRSTPARLGQRSSGARRREPGAGKRLRRRRAAGLAAVLLYAVRAQRKSGGSASRAGVDAGDPAGAGAAGRRQDDAAASRNHRALRPLSAPQRDPRPSLDPGGTRLPGRMRAPLRPADPGADRRGHFRRGHFREDGAAVPGPPPCDGPE